MGQRRNRDTVYYFEIALGARDITSSTFRTYSSLPPTCHRDIENVSGGQMAEPRSSIISDSLLEILNSTPRNEPRVFRESWVLIPKSLARKKRLLRELGKVKFWMSNEICDIKITVFDALLSAIKSHTSQRIKKIRRISRKSLQRDIMDNLSSNFLNVKWKLMINFQKFPTKIIFPIARICSIPQHLPSRYHRNIKERKKEIYKMKNVMAELDEVRPFYS